MDFIPEGFLGKWSLHKNEGFDKYLEEQGVPWIVRKMVLIAAETFILVKKPNGGYRLDIKFAMKSNGYDFELGREFEHKGLDDKNYKMTTVFDNGELVETRRSIDTPGEPAVATFTQQGNVLTQTIRCGSSHCTRIYKRAEK